MNAAAWALLGWMLSRKSFQGEAQLPIKCYKEDGPHPELEQEHRFTPADLFNISIKIVEIQGICKFNISWILNEDASIQYLKATKICESREGCIRCDYLEAFQSQTMSKHKKTTVQSKMSQLKIQERRVRWTLLYILISICHEQERTF
ncbi:interleukin-17 receptor B-like isoform X1 [Crotalus tigris]|uniref:interleukin-17 receptor B-like isoform X1 n=1 Tax=Crotalus tigris TaxID=88082 RepID=UPI00192F9350|nr:interleukin-17 receptor B-like isoform X1 [Crotalus tigris]